MNILLPDYENSILNLTSSVMRAFDLKSNHSSLAAADTYLQKGYKNIVFMVLDGLGSDVFEEIIPASSLLKKYHVENISSVYPCTTAAATTSLQSGLAPIEHGWLGWNAWFKEYGCIVDLFLDRDSLSGYKIKPSPADLYLAYESIPEKIKDTSRTEHTYPTDSTEINTHSIMPPFKSEGVSDFPAMLSRLKSCCQQAGRNFVYAYWYEPDSLMHKYGPYGQPVIKAIKDIDRLLNSLMRELKDTLLIITSDHGQIEIKKEFFLDDIPELLSCLIIPPSLENRAASLFVKPGHTHLFENIFAEIFQDTYILIPRQKVYQLNLLGKGPIHSKADDFLGDYLACAVGHTMMRFIGAHERERYYFKGHHAGLCQAEMLVPLVIVDL